MSVTDEVLVDPAVLECPFDYYRRVREEAPVHQSPLGFWLISRYDDVLSVVRDHERFSSDFGAMFGQPSAELQAVVDEGWPPVPTLLTNDPPAHTRFRSLVNTAFSPKRVAQMEPAVQSIASALVDGFIRDGRVELVTQFAVPLPLTVIADALGVDRADMPDFKRWSDDAVAPLSGLITDERRLECARSRVEMQHYMHERIEERRQARRDDLLSDLVWATLPDDDGTERGLSDAELLNVIEQLLVAGNETTTKAIAAGMQLLLERPAELTKVQSDPTLIPNLVEEVLRYESPVQILFRVPKVDVEVGGVAIPAGSACLVMYGCANRDDAHFPGGDEFDVERANARTHLAFGQGPHFCVGAPLARAEARIAFETLLGRLDELALAPENTFPRTLSMVLRGLDELHLTFTPKEA